MTIISAIQSVFGEKSCPQCGHDWALPATDFLQEEHFFIGGDSDGFLHNAIADPRHD